jgi:benzoyl-CoA reductase/2-hydroxyglutaryl-CoA dehydratase subunit BcrC/BadD/HgdB
MHLVAHTSAKKYTAELKGWEQAKRPTPLCLGMYEPVVTLMTMNVVMAALQTDDSSHQHWMNQVRTCNYWICNARCSFASHSELHAAQH